MKVKVTMLILHIVCAILFGVGAIVNPNIIAATLDTLACALWSVCIGLDIAMLINKNIMK